MAIAFDNATFGGDTTTTALTYSHTVNSNTNGLLLVAAMNNSNNSDAISGVTYNGVAMTRVLGGSNSANNQYVTLYYLLGPAQGAHNVVVSSTNLEIVSLAASYTGVKQSGFPDNSVAVLNDAANPSTVSLTPSANNCWMFCFANQSLNALTVSTGATERVAQSPAKYRILADNNAAITPPGSTSMSFTHTATGVTTMLAVTFAPFIGESQKGYSYFM